MFRKKEYICLFTGEVILARTRRSAHRYFEESYPCKVPFKMPLKQVITLKKYLKVYCGN